ncbi:MAG: outer membrane beta-barrel protein [Calditrichaceae bacterium]
MKKIITFTFLLFMMISTSYAQHPFTEFKVGFLDPSGASTGFYGGVNFGRAVDENVGVSLGLDVYRRSYTEETVIKNVEVGEGVRQDIAKSIDQSITMIPIFLQFHYTGNLSPVFNLRVTGGFGYELLWNGVTNYETKEDDTEFYGGWGWHLDAGVSYPLSRASDLYGEVTYTGGSPSRDAGETADGLPVRSEIDMSGFGARIGIRLYGLGF